MGRAYTRAWLPIGSRPTRLHAEYVTKWKESHPQEVAAWVKANDNAEPTPDALAGVFLQAIPRSILAHSRLQPKPSPLTASRKRSVKPAKEATEIQSIFFDMWRQDHARPT